MEEWKNDPQIGVAYIRVSSDDQLEYSPDSQLKLIREYAKRDGYLIPDDLVYQDDGISGKNADRRPAFRLWNIAQAKLRQRNCEMKYKRAGSRVYLLKGLLRCGDCGSTLLSSTRTSLQCCSYGRSVCQVSHSIKKDKANQIVINMLREIVASDSYVISPSAVSPARSAIRRDWDNHHSGGVETHQSAGRVSGGHVSDERVQCGKAGD